MSQNVYDASPNSFSSLFQVGIFKVYFLWLGHKNTFHFQHFSGFSFSSVTIFWHLHPVVNFSFLSSFHSLLSCMHHFAADFLNMILSLTSGCHYVHSFTSPMTAQSSQIHQLYQPQQSHQSPPPPVFGLHETIYPVFFFVFYFCQDLSSHIHYCIGSLSFFHLTSIFLALLTRSHCQCSNGPL